MFIDSVRRNTDLAQAIRSALRASGWMNEAAAVLAGYGVLGILALLVEGSLLQVCLAAVLTLFGSGYSLAAVLLPYRADLDTIERLALAGGLSLAIGGALGFALALSPWGLSLGPLLVATILFNLGCYLALLYRRRGLAGWGAYSKTAGDSHLARLSGWWTSQSQTGRRTTTALALFLLLGGAACSRALVAVTADPPMTEFYLLGESGEAYDYPEVWFTNEWLPIRYGIANREGAPAQYAVSAELGGKEIATSQAVQIKAGESRRGEVWLLPPESILGSVAGSQELRVTLYKEGREYRALRLWLKVEKPSAFLAATR